MILMTAIEPQAFLVERIGGDLVRAAVLVPGGKEPETYQATPEKIVLLTRSKAFFRTGMPFEETLLPKVKSIGDGLKIVDLREGIALRPLELHSHGDESPEAHVHHAGCSHDGLDPHIWFAPTVLKTQAATVLKTLIELDPEHEKVYRDHHDRLIEELEATRIKLAEMLDPFQGKTIFVFHPSYGYFCDEFQLKQRAIEFEGKSPKPQQLASLVSEARQTFQKTHDKPVIFVQPEFNRAPAEALAEAIGGRVIVHSALQRNVLESMMQFAREIVDSAQHRE